MLPRKVTFANQRPFVPPRGFDPSTHCVKSDIGKVIALWREELPAALRHQQSTESLFPVGALESKKRKIVLQSNDQFVFAGALAAANDKPNLSVMLFADVIM